MADLQKSLYVVIVLLSIISLSAAESEGVCSVHQGYTCDDNANCIVKNETAEGFICVCNEGYHGDGYTNGTGCKGKQPCLKEDDCHSYGMCEDGVCVCQPGFEGDGFNECKDIDECLPCETNSETCMCDKDAICTNKIGNFTCQCKNNYEGDGFSCKWFCAINADCHENGRCNGKECVCRTGYQGDGRFNCTDIDECAEATDTCSDNAECTNTEGSYTCQCKNGYSGDGYTCTAIPQTCDDILKNKPGASNGEYTIDPDGPEPLDSVTVECDMRTAPGLGITIMKPAKPAEQTSKYNPDMTVTYEQTVPQIQSVIDNSNFCYQYMSAKCRWKSTMLDGDDYWVDVKNNKHYTWGGAKTTGKCVCGQIGSCLHPASNCNCDGTIGNVIDDGKIIEKELLPIILVHMGGLTGYEKMDLVLGPVTCGPKPFGFPIDCHEAKFDSRYKIEEDGPQIIDIDGPDGPSKPILVQCDMTSYPHVGITVVVHDKKNPEVPTPDGDPITYAGNIEEINSIIQNSAFCRQDVEYDCQDSPITTNGNTRFTDLNGDVKDYWPGGMNGMCACGLNRKCFDEDAMCNCDTVDGERRKDFGPVTNKGDLPIKSVMSANAGNGSTYTVGPLMCSRREFGFEVNCQKYFLQGKEDTYTYWIDPDGPPKVGSVDTENVDPFPAHCVMVKEPPHGITIIHHEKESTQLLNGSLELKYYLVSALQLTKLRERSTYCMQSVTFTCTNTAMFEGGAANVQWYDIEGKDHTYFNGNGSSNGCACAATKSCDGGIGDLCNCDASGDQVREDIGNLIEKDNLPIIFINGMGPSVTTGPLQCFDVFPTCSDLYLFMRGKRVESEDMVSNGEYTISPGGADGVTPFKVTCQFPKTIIPINPGDNTNTTSPDGDQPITKCFDINYGNPSLTPEQVQSLMDNSRSCTQKLVFNCNNAPITDRVHFKTCDGKIQEGWAGSSGDDQCACGVTGTCASVNDEFNECNCNVQDGVERTDKGWIHTKSRLPVCEVCITIDPVTADQPSRSASYEVSPLYCSYYNIGVFGTCQNRRDSTRLGSESETMFIDPDGTTGGKEPFPVYCEIEAHPPAGITRINPKPDDKPIPKEGGVIIVEYFVYEYELIKDVINSAVFCEQDIYILCNGADFPTERGNYNDWEVYGNGTITCKEGGCSCEDGSIFGGFIGSGLPVQNVMLDPSTADRELHMGPLRCYELYKDCHDIKINNAMNGAKRGHVYAIDPDGPGGVEHFAVQCDFDTDKEIGITIVKGGPDTIVVEGQAEPGSQTTDIVYPDATPEQINVLTKQSGFCSQGIQYECKETALINNNSPADGFYTTYGGGASSSFGAGFQSDTEGCACVLTDTCPEGKSCHCDAKGPMVSYDYGVLTDKGIMPIIKLNLGGQTSPGATATATVGDVKCGPRPFDLPKDCEEVYERGFTKSGEFMIWPDSRVQPYIVRCDMDLIPGHGVTVIGNDHEDPTPIDGKDTTTETVTYNNVTKEQVEYLTDVSKYCYQPIKFDCFNTQFLGYNKFSWTDTDGQTQVYLGTGGSSGCSCSGGVDKVCGGDQTKQVLQLRKCSCDAAELQWRSDAGVISVKDDLAIFSMTFLGNTLVNSTGKITLGKLYCSQKEFDINECDTGFSDCHKWADCKNRDGTFECNCRPGYQGKKVPGVWANGRNCYDDNECALGLCPHSSDCENTVGSFKCKCKDGYKQVGPVECKDYSTCKDVCEDINECANSGLNNCSVDAVCTNLPGSYDCRCKRGFRGDGIKCTPVGICSCYGDPHCISYDTKFLTFQGDCQYIMSQDGCGSSAETCGPDEENCDASEQTFQVLTKHWNKNLPGVDDVTWVEKVTFKFLNHSVVLGQNHAVFVDGYKRNVPVNIPDMLIQKRGKWIEVLSPIGVEVHWDGFEKVEVHVPPHYRSKMCGLCGNYNSNPADDWTIGPACSGEGMVTNNPDKFGQSYVDVSYKDSNPQCTFDCNPPLPPKTPCSGEELSLAKYYCDRVFEMNGKFKTCLEKLNVDNVYTMLYDSCIYDACKVKDNKEMAMCAAAENLVKECGENYDTPFTEWRTPDMCAPECGENMEYLTCGNLERVSTCDNRTTSLTSMSEGTEQCLEDCYCKENMYMDGNKCVEKEKCGCLYNDFYYSIDETYTESDCSSIKTCNADGTFTSRPLSCSENATCSLDSESGIYGCHCKEGFMGDGETCVFNPCGSNPCNKEENCVVIGETYRCECQMGFQGECNNCQDIDECATRTHNCPPHGRCKNTIGSYTCDCISGYTKDNDRCIDINECKIGTDNCGDGTRCFNTPGHYHCEPCSVNSPPDKCCACYGGRCDIPGEVCGNDGKTYSSEADLIIARCETGKRIHLGYRGPCQASCPSESICPKWQTCNVSEETGIPTCNCLPCTEQEVISEVKVCSNKLDIYTNMCSFKKIQCAMDREDVIIPETIAPCEEKQGVDLVTEWSPWSPCSVSCGNGTMTRDRNALVEFDDYLEENYPLNMTSDCFNDPCPGSTCETVGCNTSQVCVEGLSGEGFCICPNCTNHGEDPVCGKLGNQPSSTFANPCELAKAACTQGEPYEQLYDEKCGTKPLNCTKMPRLQVQRNDRGCISSQKINLGKCDGGCGPYADNCCKPTHKKEKIFLACPDQTFAPLEVDVIESCECVPLQP